MRIIRNLSRIVPILLFACLTTELTGQKQVDLDRMEAEDKNLFAGGFSRVGIGFSRSNFSYGTTVEGVVLNPLYFNLDFGKRMNRRFGVYFGLDGNVQVKEKAFGFDRMKTFAHAGLKVGGLFYFRGNSYFAPEFGLGIINMEYEKYGVPGTIDPYCLGINPTLKYGYDRNIAGQVFVGGQMFLSYAYTWETETTTPITATSFVYGVAVSFKFGK